MALMLALAMTGPQNAGEVHAAEPRGPESRDIEPLAFVPVEGQPLAANALRLVEALECLGRPLDETVVQEIHAAAKAQDARELQKLLDKSVIALVTINPESRVKVEPGPFPVTLQQAGYTPLLVKIVNLGQIAARLRVTSPQAGAPYAGSAAFSLGRQGQPELKDFERDTADPQRFLHLEIFSQPPMTRNLSGLEVEYAILLAYSSVSGKREATLAFDVGAGSQDLGFRAELPRLCTIRPAVKVRLAIRDTDGSPCFARLLFRDALGQVYPPQPRRLAPDLFFQPHIYRRDGEFVVLPPGELTVESSRGPEYRVPSRTITIPDRPESELSFTLERWVDPRAAGFFSGDHHIHAAGCAHYTSPTEGVMPEDMFRQVAGEGLNIGCVLTWGPCFEFQRKFFSPKVDGVSEQWTMLKYDLEISGFGSQALGHVCLLNLRDQVYPGSDGTKDRGWPTWTTPVMRWAKEQGAVTGYAHSASGLQIDATSAAKRLFAEFDADQSGLLSEDELRPALLPMPPDQADTDRDKVLSQDELTAAIERASHLLPNLAIPEMNSVGAMELPVAASLGLCDFISAMDTARVPEWNMWYHMLNSGVRLAASGETDFPCMSSVAVGQGRSYVQLGQPERLDYAAWCRALAEGRSYVSDGYAHALEFTVSGKPSGETLELPQPSDEIVVRARVAFAPETPLAVAYGTLAAEGGERFIGDTVTLHGPRRFDRVAGGKRKVEIVINGRAVAQEDVPADGQAHTIERTVALRASSWVAVRHFPQMHTNPVYVTVADKPIRASRDSGRWVAETIAQLWRLREKNIAEGEREEARATFLRAIDFYHQRARDARE